MKTSTVAPPAPAPASQQGTDDYLTVLCKKLRREVVLTPPAIIDDLCAGVPTRWICLKAIYVDEVREIARLLGRSHLLRFTTDCK